MLKGFAVRLFVVLFGLALGLGLCELALNVIVRQDEDGNRTYRGIHLKPFALPQRRLATLLKELRAAKTSPIQALTCRPAPMATRQPTTLRTMWCRKALASKSKHQ